MEVSTVGGTVKARRMIRMEDKSVEQIIRKKDNKEKKEWNDTQDSEAMGKRSEDGSESLFMVEEIEAV